jgi:hypothetical protein
VWCHGAKRAPSRTRLTNRTMRVPREIFYAGALMALGGTPAPLLGLARAYRVHGEPSLSMWVLMIGAVVWLIAGGVGLLRLQRWAALLLSVPIAILGLGMLNIVSIFCLLPLAITVAGWRTLR